MLFLSFILVAITAVRITNASARKSRGDASPDLLREETFGI
jgi:hypothetical protein